MNFSAKNVTFALAAILASGFVTIASVAGDTNWEKNHPRREQVNVRLANQYKRIQDEVKAGEITKVQAADLHIQDHQIRQEERLMASQNGGHITKLEQKTLNQQENAVSKKIGS